MTSETPKLISHIVASRVLLSRFDDPTKEATNLGKKVAAIVPAQDPDTHIQKAYPYCIMCYESKSRVLMLNIPILSSFNIRIIDDTSITFHDPRTMLLYIMKFANEVLLENFIIGLCMAKVKKDDIDTDGHRLIIQDLQYIAHSNLSDFEYSVSDMNYDYIDSINIYLKIWLASKAKHPYKRAKMVYNSEKKINLSKSREKVLPAIVRGLKGMSIHCQRLIISPPEYAFGVTGNKKLKVPENATLIIQLQLKSIEMQQNSNSLSNILENTMTHSLSSSTAADNAGTTRSPSSPSASSMTSTTPSSAGGRRRSKKSKQRGSKTDNNNNNNMKEVLQSYDNRNAFQCKQENEKLRAHIVLLNKKIAHQNKIIDHLKNQNEKLRNTYECTRAEELQAKNSISSAVSKTLSKNSSKYDFGGHVANVSRSTKKSRKKSLENKKTKSHEIGVDYDNWGMYDSDPTDDWSAKSFLEWNADNIIDWILSLNNGMFLKYSKALKISVRNANLKGKNMNKISSDEWKDFGIIDFDDRCTVVDHIRMITHQHKNKNGDNAEHYANNFNPLSFN